MSEYFQLPGNGRARARISESGDELVVRIKLEPIYRHANGNGNWPVYWVKNTRLSRMDPRLRGLQFDCYLYLNDMNPDEFHKRSGLMRGPDEG